MIVLSAKPAQQTASWLRLLDLHERLAQGWTLAGGQLVHLHCAERGQVPVRPTNDADTVTDVRSDPRMLATSAETPSDIGFRSAGDPGLGRHRRDFVVLARLLTARDFWNEELTKKLRQRLRAMVAAARKDRALLLEVPDAESSLDRLDTAGES